MLLTLLSPQTAPATTSAILIGSSNNPSYRSGFYSPRRGGVPKYPSLWDGCVGAWAPSLGATGLTLRDESVYGNHGTLTNMDQASDWVVSGGKGALDFDGVNDYVDCGPAKSAQITSGDCTYSIWMNTGSHFSVPFSQGTFGQGVYFQFLTNAVRFHRGGTSREFSVTDHLEIKLYTYRQQGSTGELWLGSTLVGSEPMPTTTAFSPEKLLIGAYYDGSNYGFNATFIFSELRIYNRALTPSEIKLLATRRGIAYESKRRLAVRSGAATPSGTLAKTLDSATLSSSGTLSAGATGTLTSTLDAATLASTGTVGSGVTATVSVTLSDATLSASGTLAAGLTGSTNSTLADAALSSTGTLAAGASGTVTRTLDSCVVSSTGTLAAGASGSVTRTLDNATLSATGGAAGSVSGSVSSTLAAVTCSSSATLTAGLSGSVTRTLADATLSSTGSFSAGLTAQVNRALDSCVVSSTGTVANGATGTLSVQLASATLVSGNVALGGFRLKVAGEWKNANAFVKVMGTWKNATPYVKVSGVWKQ